MQHWVWMALAAFWTILVNGDTTEKGIQQDNSHPSDPTIYYGTTIDSNIPYRITLSSLVTQPSTLLNPLVPSIDENQVTRVNNHPLFNNHKKNHIKDSALQNFEYNESNLEKSIGVTLHEFPSRSSNEKDIRDKKKTNKNFVSNYLSLDKKYVNKNVEMEKVSINISPISKSQRVRKVHAKNSEENPSTQANTLDRFSTSSKPFQLAMEMSNAPLNSFKHENNNIKEIDNNRRAIVGERDKHPNVIKYKNNAVGDSLKMKETISRERTGQQNQSYRNTTVITDDVNISHGVTLKSSPELTRIALMLEDEGNLLDSTSVEGILNNIEHSKSSTELLPVLSHDGQELSLYEYNSTGESPQDRQFYQNDNARATDGAVHASIKNKNYGTNIVEIIREPGEIVEKLLIQKDNKIAVKNKIKERELVSHYNQTTKITMKVREAVEKTIPKPDTSENRKFSTISAEPLGKMLVQDFSLTRIRNELVPAANTISTFDSKIPRSTTEQTQKVDSSKELSAVTKINGQPSFQAYITKSGPIRFTTPNPLRYSFNYLWDDRIDSVMKNKVSQTTTPASNIDKLMKNSQITHHTDRFNVNPINLTYSPSTSSTNHYDRNINIKRLSKSLQLDSTSTDRSIDQPKFYTSTINSLENQMKKTTKTILHIENEHMHSIQNSTSSEKPFSELDSQTDGIIYEEYLVTNAPQFVELTDSVSLLTTMENPPITIQSDKHRLDDSEAENSSRASLNQWPVKHSAVVEGDLVLGGLMMVHERKESVTCGPVMPQGGVQALEAMLYTLDWINQRGIVPGVKIGAHILDDCDKDTYGLEMAVDFIKGESVVLSQL
uniref:Uncharacterized protein n=1 Tax=Bracon brevicornis TaxID=1563983 RepID=A0A6V7J9P6_9HYME